MDTRKILDNSKFAQIGFVVHDIEAAKAAYALLFLRKKWTMSVVLKSMQKIAAFVMAKTALASSKTGRSYFQQFGEMTLITGVQELFATLLWRRSLSTTCHWVVLTV